VANGKPEALTSAKRIGSDVGVQQKTLVRGTVDHSDHDAKSE